jgi:hypothetical protein
MSVWHTLCVILNIFFLMQLYATLLRINKTRKDKHVEVTHVSLTCVTKMAPEHNRRKINKA